MSVLLVGCGGFGVKRLGELFANKATLGDVQFLALDGSESDLIIAGLPSENVMLVEGKDGAGKIRGANAKEYCEWVDGNMGKIPEADLYILVHSLSGGTGNVIGPALAMRLTERNKNVISVGVITGRSMLDAKNTVNTLNGLGAYANKLGKPMFLSVMDQSNQPASVVDLATVANVAAFSRIGAFKHPGLDTSDINSFFAYDKHGVQGQLTEITHFGDSNVGSIDETMHGRTLTQLSIVNSSDAYLPELMALFDCHGVDSTANDDDNVHFVTSTQSMGALAKAVTERYAKFEEANKALNTASVFGTSNGDMVY
jgi:hypothetical protein